MKRLIIAIDGPAASGKSTTAKLLAAKLGYIYLDTGAMYRACALAAVDRQIALDNLPAIQELMQDIDISIRYQPQGNQVLLYAQDVTQRIRQEDISRLASDISTLQPVREKMVFLQRKMGEQGGVVMDGRDIGTVVFPQAEVKFFMNATPQERAQRRCLELQAKGVECNLASVTADLMERDRQDSTRALAPLKPAEDAILIDTTDLSIEQQVDKLYGIILSRMEEDGVCR